MNLGIVFLFWGYQPMYYYVRWLGLSGVVPRLRQRQLPASIPQPVGNSAKPGHLYARRPPVGKKTAKRYSAIMPGATPTQPWFYGPLVPASTWLLRLCPHGFHLLFGVLASTFAALAYTPLLAYK